GQGELPKEWATKVGPTARRRQRRRFAPKKGEAKLDGLALSPEALRAVVIGQAGGTDTIENGNDSLRRRHIRVAHQDARGVASQVARLQLVAMSMNREQADAIAFQLRQLWLGANRDRDHLTSDGPAIFQPSGADFANRQVEPAGYLTSEKLGSQIALLNPQE